MTPEQERLAERSRRLHEAMTQVSISANEFAQQLRENVVPAFRQAYIQFSRLLGPEARFELWLGEQPRWQRPLMRFAYRIERWVLR